MKVHKISKIKTEEFPHISGDADEILHSKLVLADPKEVSNELNSLSYDITSRGDLFFF